jgi:hypothetical protein
LAFKIFTASVIVPAVVIMSSDHQDVLAFDVADDVLGLDVLTALAPLIDDADLAAEHVGVDLGAL